MRYFTDLTLYCPGTAEISERDGKDECGRGVSKELMPEIAVDCSMVITNTDEEDEERPQGRIFSIRLTTTYAANSDAAFHPTIEMFLSPADLVQVHAYLCFLLAGRAD